MRRAGRILLPEFTGVGEDSVCIRIDQGISGGSNGADESGSFWIVAQFFAECGNMDVDGAVEDLVIPFADFFEELFSGFDAAGGFGEGEEEVEFDRGEVERLVVENGGTGGGLNVEGADVDGGLGIVG